MDKIRTTKKCASSNWFWMMMMMLRMKSRQNRPYCSLFGKEAIEVVSDSITHFGDFHSDCVCGTSHIQSHISTNFYCWHFFLLLHATVVRSIAAQLTTATWKMINIFLHGLLSSFAIICVRFCIPIRLVSEYIRWFEYCIHLLQS